MPRKNRIVSSEGLYHVLNRGNYRASIFEEEGAKIAFEKCLFEACAAYSWELQAYCVMSNHFHLCIATPAGNLSEGMRWLQATFAARFNRLRRETGHLFQGRFKSLLVEPGDHLLDLVNYIHLNPARAGMVEASSLRAYRWTSLSRFPQVRSRPAFFDARWMDYGDALSDSPAGWRRYFSLLAARAAQDPQELDALERRMNRGWCIGSATFKKAVSEDLEDAEDAVRLEGDALRDLNRQRWEESLRRCLRLLKKKPDDVEGDRRSAPWKVAIAAKLKRETSATNAWIAHALDMGVPNAVSDYCGKYVRGAERDCPFAKKLKTER